jgi:SPP1 gp7 family putative phage head morphogenesis protein
MSQKKALENFYAPRIAKALASSFSGIEQAIEAVEKALSEKAAGDSIATIVARYITYNNKPLASVIGELSMDAGFVGTVNAVKEMGAGAKLSYGLAQAAAKPIDWNSWTPGHPLAATNLGDGMLSANLDSLGITLDGIGQTSIDRIGNAIASGVSQGFPARTIARSVNAVIADPVRAMTIAVTESNRAYNMAAVDQYTAAGTKQFEWIAYDTACPECASLEGAHDLSDTVPPAHPNCRCTVAAVVS